MEVVFKNAHGLKQDEIDLLKRKVDIHIPEALLEFLRKYCNAVPMINEKLCSFKTVHSDGWTSSSFIEKIPSIKNIIDDFEDRSNLQLYADHFKLSKNFVEIEYLAPFAFAANGVLYCAIGGTHKEKIFFADNGDFGILNQSDNLNSFWNSVFENTGA